MSDSRVMLNRFIRLFKEKYLCGVTSAALAIAFIVSISFSFSNPYRLLYLLPLLFFSIHFYRYNNKKACRLETIISISGLFIGIIVAEKVYDLLDTRWIYDTADRCLAWKTQAYTQPKITVNPSTGKPTGIQFSSVITPIMVNEGGDAHTYGDLLSKLKRTQNNSELNTIIKGQLNKIYENIENTENEAFFGLVTIDKHSRDGLGIETPKDFNPSNIISQLTHRTFWQTRAKCARLLRGKDARSVFEQRSNDDFDSTEMFLKLKSIIETDHSLVARVEALKTYRFWACEREDEKSRVDCNKTKFTNDEIYHFEEVLAHWTKNHETIAAHLLSTARQSGPHKKK